MNAISSLRQLPIRSAANILDSLGNGAFFLSATWFPRFIKSPSTRTHHLFDGVLLTKPVVRVAYDAAKG